MSQTIKPPRCPKCQSPMTLARVLPKLASLPELRSFECRPCGEVFTDEAKDD